MNVNGITESPNTYSDYKTSGDTASKAAADTTSETQDVGAVYEPSGAKSETSAKKNVANPELVNKLKAEAEARTMQLQDIVNKLLTKQATAYNTANGLKSIYEALEVDPATKAQAQADIAEDGYWGVEQTSSRIFDFAMALSGGDKETMEKMKDAFLKGYDQAEKIWGDKLPEISKNTYDAVLKKFEDYANETEEESAQ